MRTLCVECQGKGCDECFDEGYAGRTVVSEIARVNKPIDVQRMIDSEKHPENKYWPSLWQDIEHKVKSGVTNGKEVYRAFASELEEMAEHSPILKQILFEQRAERDLVSAALAVAQVESMSPEEKQKQRAIAEARLGLVGVSRDEAEADEMSREGEYLGAPRPEGE
jgi:general secretion pathway protein E